MSELVVVALKLGFLALLWLFILFVGNVVRTDLFGRKVPATEIAQASLVATAGPTAKMSRKVEKRLPTIEGSVPDLVSLPLGCPFAGRCAYTEDACFTDEPPAVPMGSAHWFRCRRADVVLDTPELIAGSA